MNFPANCLCRFYAAYAVACWHHPIHTWQHVGNHSCNATAWADVAPRCRGCSCPKWKYPWPFWIPSWQSASLQASCTPHAISRRPAKQPKPMRILPAGIAPESACAASQILVFMPICVSLSGSPTPIRHLRRRLGAPGPGRSAMQPLPRRTLRASCLNNCPGPRLCSRHGLPRVSTKPGLVCRLYQGNYNTPRKALIGLADFQGLDIRTIRIQHSWTSTLTSVVLAVAYL